MHISEKTKLYIYGCGSLGELFAKSIENTPFKIIGFIDKRADEIKSFYNIKVSSINRVKIECPNNCLVIVAVKNVFEHETIARELFARGFRYILYKPAEIIDGSSNNDLIKINDLYESMLQLTRQECFWNDIGNKVIGEDVPAYQYQTVKLVDKSSVDQGYKKLVYVPVQLIFTDKNTNDDSETSDKPILWMTHYFELYNYFSNNGSYPETYILYCIKAVENVKATERWKNNIFRNRYIIYKQMVKALNIDPMYFVRNAPNANWNHNGYFNLCSGKHRASFLAYKGFDFLPLKISMEDYDKWINNKKLIIFEDNMKKNDFNFLSEPVEHPFFYNIECANDLFIIDFSKYIIGELLHIIKCKRIVNGLVIENYGYIARIVSKIPGVNVDILQHELLDENDFVNINSLTYSNVTIISNIEKKYDFVIIVNDFKKYLDICSRVTENLYFIFGNGDKRENYRVNGTGIFDGKQSFFGKLLGIN